MFKHDINESIKTCLGFNQEDSQSCVIESIQQGASGRRISRVSYAGQSVIVIEYDDSRDENAQFVPLSLQLKQAGILVPQIISYTDRDGCGYCLVQDLGAQTLLSKIKQNQDEQEQIALYKQVIDSVASLHQLPMNSIDPQMLQPRFDKELYRWEQSYFIEHYGASIGLTEEQQQAWLNQPELIELAENLAMQPRTLIHRDCQSENIMLHQGQAYLIDFQGMRLGLPEYDWASLIYDPYVAQYMTLNNTQQTLQNYLIKEYQMDICIFQACALQRLMQAIGAYAKLSKQGLINYQSYIQPTFKQLSQLSENNANWNCLFDF